MQSGANCGLIATVSVCELREQLQDRHQNPVSYLRRQRPVLLACEDGAGGHVLWEVLVDKEELEISTNIQT